MRKLILLGTGNAMVTKCFNTCFALNIDDEYFLVDAGGGNGILAQFRKSANRYDKNPSLIYYTCAYRPCYRCNLGSA